MWPRSCVSSLALLVAVGCAPRAAQPSLDAPLATLPAPVSPDRTVGGAVAGSALPARTESASATASETQQAAGDEGATATEQTGQGSLFAFELETPPLARPTGAIAASLFDEELARWNVGGNGDPQHPSNQERYHPAARVMVDAVSVSRRLPKKARGELLTRTKLVAQARSSGYWPFRLCLEAGLRRQPELGGVTKVRITLGAHGRVLHARLLNTELQQRATATCVVRAARQLRFSAPLRRLDADLTIQLWPGDAPLPTVDDPSSAAGADGAGLQSRWMAELADMGHCYAAGLERDAALWGRIALRVRWSTSGAVTSAQEHGTRFPDPGVTRCMSDVLQRVQPGMHPGLAELVFVVRAGTPPSKTEQHFDQERRKDPRSPAEARDALHSSPCASCPSLSSPSP